MRKFVCSSVLVLLAVVAQLAALPVKAEAVAACYQWSLSATERWVLSIKSHSMLVTGERPYSVHGKYVSATCGVATISGSIVTNASSSHPPKGAHLGLWAHMVGGTGSPGIANETCFPIVMNCTTTATNPTPATWSCQSRSETPAYHGITTLTEVPVTDAQCNAF